MPDRVARRRLALNSTRLLHRKFVLSYQISFKKYVALQPPAAPLNVIADLATYSRSPYLGSIYNLSTIRHSCDIFFFPLNAKLHANNCVEAWTPLAVSKRAQTRVTPF